jgi:hypothetical protein
MRMRNSGLGLALLFPFALALGLGAGGCGSDPQSSASGGAGGPGANGSGTAGGGAGVGAGAGQGGIGGMGVGGIGAGDQGSGGMAACVATTAEATLEKKPVDIIFLIDNSGSMGDNITSVQKNINDNFAAIIAASGVDYRVIMISEHGPVGEESICIKAPLSSTDCNPVPAEPGQNDPIFFQYSIPISSHDSWCKAIEGYDGTLPDQFGLAPTGWSQWLRKEAFKVFVEITDDNVSCSLNGTTLKDNNKATDGETTAAAFDSALLAIGPDQFGDAAKRNYVWHSIIGLVENDPATAVYAPGDPIITGVCDTAVHPGTGYQALSITTGGLRFPICQFASYDLVFQEIAKGVIDGAKVACEFPVPEAPAGDTIDLETVVLNYTPGGMGDAQKMKQVAGAAACMPSSFYIEGDLIKLCPDTCAIVQKDGKAKIEIAFGCKQDIN